MAEDIKMFTQKEVEVIVAYACRYYEKPDYRDDIWEPMMEVKQLNLEQLVAEIILKKFPNR